MNRLRIPGLRRPPRPARVAAPGRRHRVLAVLAAVVATAGVVLSTASPAAAYYRDDFNGLAFLQTGGTTITWRDPCADNPGSIYTVGGLSTGQQLVNGRVAQAGDTFYLQLTLSHTSVNLCTHGLAVPAVTLPAGLVRADDRLPLRCFATLPPITVWREYLNTCSVTGGVVNPDGTSTMTIWSNTFGPSFHLSDGTRWRYWIPVRATAGTYGTTTFSVAETVPGVGGTNAALRFGALVGDPGSPIWQKYLAIGGYPAVGAPSQADYPLPWSWPGRFQYFEADTSAQNPYSRGTTITWSPTYGTHVLAPLLSRAWSAYTLGAARDDAAWVTRYTFRQHFDGGYITYDDISESTRVTRYCTDPTGMNC